MDHYEGDESCVVIATAGVIKIDRVLLFQTLPLYFIMLLHNGLLKSEAGSIQLHLPKCSFIILLLVQN